MFACSPFIPNVKLVPTNFPICNEKTGIAFKTRFSVKLRKKEIVRYIGIIFRYGM